MNFTKSNWWKPGIDYPAFMLERSLETLRGGYLIGEETPRDAIRRIAKRVDELIPKNVYKGNLEEAVFNHIWEGSICPSTPVWSNFGTERGLPISCFGSYISDSITGIYGTLAENAKMSQLGGGTSSYWGDVRPRGSRIARQDGSTGGVFEFLGNYDSMIQKVSQGGTRRGSHAVYVPFSHGDIDEVLNIKKVGSSIQDLFYGVTITREDYDKIYSGDSIALDKWARILESRSQTGIPYILNSTNANEGSSTPPWYGKSYSKILASNLCSEIMLPSNEYESFVCCLMSMNALYYDTWKDNDAVEVAMLIMEAILEDFITKTTGVEEMQKARRFAQRHHAVGLGILGYADYLQSKMQPYIGWFSTGATRRIYGTMKTKAEAMSEHMGKLMGNAPFINEYNIRENKNVFRRNTTWGAQAPTTSNATIQGVFAGMDAQPSNYYVQKSAKGNFTVANPFLTKLIKENYPEHDTPDMWGSIRDSSGSIMHLNFMTEEEKEVFLTFSEINQFEIVRLAGVRQEYLDQGQSLNVHISPDTDPAHISALYLMGEQLGIKAFYYQRSSNILRDKNKTNVLTMDAEACVSCAG